MLREDHTGTTNVGGRTSSGGGGSGSDPTFSFSFGAETAHACAKLLNNNATVTSLPLAGGEGKRSEGGQEAKAARGVISSGVAAEKDVTFTGMSDVVALERLSFSMQGLSPSPRSPKVSMKALLLGDDDITAELARDVRQASAAKGEGAGEGKVGKEEEEQPLARRLDMEMEKTESSSNSLSLSRSTVAPEGLHSDEEEEESEKSKSSPLRSQQQQRGGEAEGEGLPSPSITFNLGGVSSGAAPRTQQTAAVERAPSSGSDDESDSEEKRDVPSPSITFNLGGVKPTSTAEGRASIATDAGLTTRFGDILGEATATAMGDMTGRFGYLLDTNKKGEGEGQRQRGKGRGGEEEEDLNGSISATRALEDALAEVEDSTRFRAVAGGGRGSSQRGRKRGAEGSPLLSPGLRKAQQRLRQASPFRGVGGKNRRITLAPSASPQVSPALKAAVSHSPATSAGRQRGVTKKSVVDSFLRTAGIRFNVGDKPARRKSSIGGLLLKAEVGSDAFIIKDDADKLIASIDLTNKQTATEYAEEKIEGAKHALAEQQHEIEGTLPFMMTRVNMAKGRELDALKKELAGLFNYAKAKAKAEWHYIAADLESKDQEVFEELSESLEGDRAILQRLLSKIERRENGIDSALEVAEEAVELADEVKDQEELIESYSQEMEEKKGELEDEQQRMREQEEEMERLQQEIAEAEEEEKEYAFLTNRIDASIEEERVRFSCVSCCRAWRLAGVTSDGVVLRFPFGIRCGVKFGEDGVVPTVHVEEKEEEAVSKQLLSSRPFQALAQPMPMAKLGSALKEADVEVTRMGEWFEEMTLIEKKYSSVPVRSSSNERLFSLYGGRMSAASASAPEAHLRVAMIPKLTADDIHVEYVGGKNMSKPSMEATVQYALAAAEKSVAPTLGTVLAAVQAELDARANYE
uniref:Spc7 kinetochore protein domain-containing protein n=1 Tax=Palpitomonas bilix TaxID=652834 RepID=A0A7S3D926_9EUKA